MPAVTVLHLTAPLDQAEGPELDCLLAEILSLPDAVVLDLGPDHAAPDAAGAALPPVLHRLVAALRRRGRAVEVRGGAAPLAPPVVAAA